MADHDEQAAIGAAVRSLRRVLRRLADPAPGLGAALARAEALLEPGAALPLLEFDPFAPLPADPLPPADAQTDERARKSGGTPAPPLPRGAQPTARARSGEGAPQQAGTPAVRPAPAVREAPDAWPGAQASAQPDEQRGLQRDGSPPVVSFRRRPSAGATGAVPRAVPTGQVAPVTTPVSPPGALAARPAEMPGAPAAPEPRSAVTLPVPGAPPAPASGMELLGQLARDVLSAPRQSAPAAAEAQRRAAAPPGAAGDDTGAPRPADLQPATAASGVVASGLAGVAAPGAPHGIGAPDWPQSPGVRGGAAAGPAQAPGEVVRVPSEAGALPAERLDAAELARLINEVLVEQAQRHGVDLS